MPGTEFFQRLGLYAVERFLDPAACRDLREALRSGSWQPGTVGNSERTEFAVEPDFRSVRRVSVNERTASRVRERLVAVQPAIQAHYQVTLTGYEPFQFLAYGVGDHYKPHRDEYESSADPEGNTARPKARRVSVVIFLNDRSEHEAPSHYGGGALTFYGLFDNPSGPALGIPLDADQGLLVTFPSGMLHAVAPVTHGERYTIVTWFF